MSTRFERCFAILIGHEGGYSRAREDRGNWTSGKIGVGILRGTKFGISAAAFPNIDIAALDLDAARAIYRAEYWAPIRGDDLPPALGLLAFDAAVNNGVGAATEWLQRAAGVAADGIIGPKTLAAAAAEGVAQRFHIERVVAMTQMVAWGVFGKGWAIRLATLPFQAASLEAMTADP